LGPFPPLCHWTGDETASWCPLVNILFFSFDGRLCHGILGGKRPFFPPFSYCSGGVIEGVGPWSYSFPTLRIPPGILLDYSFPLVWTRELREDAYMHFLLPPLISSALIRNGWELFSIAPGGDMHFLFFFSLLPHVGCALFRVLSAGMPKHLPSPFSGYGANGRSPLTDTDQPVDLLSLAAKQ